MQSTAYAKASYVKVDKCNPMSLNSNETVGVIDQSERKIQINPRDFRAYFKLAESLSALCQFDHSIEKYTYVVENAKDRQLIAEAYLGIGYALHERRDNIETTLAAYRNAIQLVNDKGNVAADAYVGIGRVFAGQNKYEDAIAAHRKSLLLRENPSRLSSRELVYLLRRQNRLEEVLDIYQQQLIKTPNDPDTVDDLGQLLIEMGRYSDAVSIYQNYSSNNPSISLSNYMGLGDALFKQGNRTAALDAYRKAVVVFQPGRGFDVCYSSDARYSESYTEQLVDQGFYDLAIALCRREESFFPEDASRANRVGEILLRQGKLNEALEEFKRAVKISPDDKKAQANLDATERLIRQH